MSILIDCRLFVNNIAPGLAGFSSTSFGAATSFGLSLDSDIEIGYMVRHSGRIV